MVSPYADPSTKLSTSQSSGRHMPADSFKCPPLKNPATQDVFQSIVKGRKSWKSLKGGEIVWPPELEAALIEGLENYQPDDSRETRLLGRFPMRNRFISDWIFEKTGKRRTAKQVGSRLQQLRDTCGGKKLLKLLSPIRPLPRAITPPPKKDSQMTHASPSSVYDYESSSESSTSSPPTPTEAHTTLQTLLYRGVERRVEEMPNTIVYIDVTTDPWLTPERSWTPSKEALAEERTWSERGLMVARASQHPRHITEIEPTITFMSPTAISAQSHFTVHTADGVVFSEITPLETVGTSQPSTMDESLLYKTLLVPGFWETIVHSADASKYVITQRVIPDTSSSTSASIFSAMYKFNNVDPQPTLIPQQTHAQARVDQHQQNYSTQKASTHIQVAPNEKTNFDFGHLGLPIPMDSQSFNDLISFSKSPQLFEMDSFAQPDDWSSSSSYPSPVVATAYGMLIPMDEQHMSLPHPSLSPFLSTELSNYGL
jgi:transcriptional enhancer factor